jgi:hypothetical protein
MASWPSALKAIPVEGIVVPAVVNQHCPSGTSLDVERVNTING